MKWIFPLQGRTILWNLQMGQWKIIEFWMKIEKFLFQLKLWTKMAEAAPCPQPWENCIDRVMYHDRERDLTDLRLPWRLFALTPRYSPAPPVDIDTHPDCWIWTSSCRARCPRQTWIISSSVPACCGSANDVWLQLSVDWEKFISMSILNILSRALSSLNFPRTSRTLSGNTNFCIWNQTASVNPLVLSWCDSISVTR